ncbi:preprotein translocase subunit SecA [Intestinimonas butyriciproducens]|uniref:Protein translocase subunit SecA n=2 Tax=Intestinimonas butyriciproducens TaxID=1297617 RepID=A0A2U1CGA2_9FIRM|nr:preprotein translocase subunit SecA [Intestinimonas butyriciproducens]SCJ56269.1 preprotein translocase subunit SecA [uncultured Clostridium sp.]MCI6363325.1 preprotein translocase subunit SecA [Intestinimonas butyriciproducens]MCR1904620.1 preprotein translocase subunit SecA [Intestinimonas butyriciproducens]MDB7830264.1 preprotein translocase subunit SecA [Intestinimonas butyriciproducens]MDB7863570.1 preprotein translocase subunit SecA [Intestinimonas butyriciproducens]
MGLLKKLFGTTSEKELKAISPIVNKIEALEPEYAALTDEQLQAKTPEFKQRYQNGENLDALLPEAFAACREAAWRVLGMKPYRVQLIGGIILHQGRIAEMKTGEGKTLVATLPAYLNALTGEGVHIVTVNDYLAKRDSEWMGKVYRFMGLSVGLVIHGVQGPDKHRAYEADITYGTNNEFGFDYLRDNMAIYKQEMVQRGHSFAIVDEVDSILIDEARTPLIISGQGDESTQLYTIVDNFVSRLTCKTVASVDEKEEEDPNETADYIVDEKARTVTLTANGIRKAEQAFHLENLADPENTTLSHHINQAIRARGLMKRDIDYVVKDGEVIIVDEFTGRLMFGRRYSEGLHQAIEAKEHVTVARESKTLATITFQNYFRLYDKLSGMTGTAMTEEDEFNGTYSLDVVEIPTNKPLARVDHHDVVYKNEAGKYRAIIQQIEECHAKGQPVLVGTISIEKSELLSGMLKKKGIQHNVLNAKNHEKEAEIVAQAGKYGAVTVATNMAGRGTDIMLGGNAEFLAKNDLRKAGLSDELIAEATGFAETENEEILNARKLFSEAEAKYKAAIKPEADKVRAAGGLFILGTERHESRRIDNQLRGRAGRQGDPGETRFYLSLEDDIMRLFGSERVMGMMEKLGVDEDTPIEQKMLTNAIESAQKQVESKNFQQRKNVLEYDDVMNTQREVIYKQRRQVLDGEDMKASVENMIRTTIQNAIHGRMGEQKHMDAESFREAMAPFRGVFLASEELKLTDEELQKYTAEELCEMVETRAFDIYQKKEQALGAPLMRELERVMMLRVVDEYWMEHLDNMTELRQGIGLRAYGQNDPVVEYKREGYAMFEEMIAAIQEETVRRVFIVRVQTNAQTVERKRVAKVTGTSGGDGTVKQQPVVHKGEKIGRNDPCPCGSGLKWKKCTCKEYHPDLQ